MGWYQSKFNTILESSPFLQVTNREMSLFLWQNPEFMRANAKLKANYLPAFRYLDKVTIEPSLADDYVSAPPELVFRYHTWKRLIFEDFVQRPMLKKEFSDFLSYAEEWQPYNWGGASSEYALMVDKLPHMDDGLDLSQLSLREVPLEVRMAFLGWKNYFLEGEAIDGILPTYGRLRAFLDEHPHFARNYWINIIEGGIPNYLKSIAEGDDDAIVPAEELSPFLKVAFYNSVNR